VCFDVDHTGCYWLARSESQQMYGTVLNL